MKNPKTNEPVNNTFIGVINNLRKGKLLTEVSEQLQALTQAVMEHRRPGKLTLTIKIAPQGDGDVVVLTDDVEIKAPKTSPTGSVFYTTDDGLLSRDDPNQKEMALGVIAKPQPDPVKLPVAVNQ